MTRNPSPIFIIMGVSGSGKSVIGALLGNALSLPFIEGDLLHSDESVSKMRSGTPLDDTDRGEWLARIRARAIEVALQAGGCVISCSALKARYRAALAEGLPDVHFLYLKGTFEEIYPRVLARQGHFMSPSLLRSQFEALEEPLDVPTFSVTDSPECITTAMIDHCRPLLAK